MGVHYGNVIFYMFKFGGGTLSTMTGITKPGNILGHFSLNRFFIWKFHCNPRDAPSYTPSTFAVCSGLSMCTFLNSPEDALSF